MRTTTVFIILLALCAPNGAAACWYSPVEGSYFSESRQHKVTVSVTDEEKGTKGQITVFDRHGDGWVQSWTIPAVNPVRPARVYIDDTGSCVITVGNWFGHDEGNDEVVIYREGALLEQYSVANILGAPFFRRGFHSTAGAEWLIDSYAFFGPEQHFSLWLDILTRWVVIDINDGSLIDPDTELQARCEQHARKVTYARIEAGDANHDDYRRLARFLRPEDVKLFEDLLTHPEKAVRRAYGYSDETSEFYYSSANSYRQLAEMALDALESGNTDAITDAIQESDLDKHYRHLGSLRMSATFDHGPRAEDGVVALWLEPDNDPYDGSAHERPEHSMRIEFKWMFPYELKKANKPLAMPVTLIMYGVTPGRYRIHGYWSKSIKDFYRIDEDFWKQAGDYSIVNSPEVEIRKGAVTNAAVSFERKSDPNQPDSGDG